MKNQDDDELRPEYDLTKLKGAVRGKYFKRDMLRQALRGPDRAVVLQVVSSLGVDDRKALFREWINLARAAHSPFQVAWDIIESLPREWVLQHIEKEVDAILENEEETDYWMFLQLFARLDHGLVKKLAMRAAHHGHPDIRELGQDYLANTLAAPDGY
jgi:hypothetical protein